MKNVFPMLKVKRYCVNRFQVKLINYRKNNCEKRHSGGGGGIFDLKICQGFRCYELRCRQIFFAPFCSSASPAPSTKQ